MGKPGILAAGAAVLMLSAAGPALADATLTLVVGGEAFNGPPQFAVSFDGKPIGQASVDAAIDTGKDGRFADAPDKAKYVKSFDFKIPDAAFKPKGVVAIKLTNAAEGPAGSKQHRELFVQSVAVNGRVVPAMSLSMRSSVGVEPTAMLGDYLVVSQNEIEGIALPSGGWATEMAEVKPVDTPAKPATLEVSTAYPVKTPAVASDAAPETVDGDANPDPEANAPDCGINQKFQVLGFNANSNDLTPKARTALDAVVKAIGSQKCVVHLTGYSSTEGDYAHNALFSIERSRNALQYLAAQGVKFRKYSANGVGETTQFGDSPNANRRVVVTVSP